MERVTVGQHLRLVAFLALLAAVLLYPIWLTVEGAFRGPEGGFTLFHLGEVFRDPVLRGGLLNSLAIATVTTVLSVSLAMPLAMLSARCDYPGKALLGGLLLVPLILPPFVGAIGLRAILGRFGAANTLLMDLGWIDAPLDLLGRGGFAAVVVLEALHLYPILYLNLLAALANIDPAMEEAAENLGAGPWTRFRRVTLPLVRPGLFAGGTIVFIWSFTELGTPLMLEYSRVTPVQIFNGIKEMEASAQPYALTAVLLFTATILYLFGKVAFGRAAAAGSGKASIRASIPRLRGLRGAVAAIAVSMVIAISALPHLGVILSSLAVEGTWYRSILPRALTLAHFSDALAHPLAAGSIRNSLLLSSVAVVASVVVGVAIARLLARSRVPGRFLLDALVMLPLAVPGLVLAFGYVSLSLHWPFSGAMPSWLQPLVASSLPTSWVAWLDDGPLKPIGDVLGADPNPMVLLIVAYAVRRLPYVVRAAVAGMEQTGVAVEEAAANLGAGRFTVLRRIVLPLIFANLLGGALLAFSFSMLEVSDSLILAQRERDYPITKAIYTLAERLGDGPAIASAMGVWGMALLTTTLLAATLLLGRRIGALFRA